MINIEKQIADEIANSNGLSVTRLGLRFDKVAVRLLGNVRIFVEKNMQIRGTVLLTLTAPVKIPAKTEQEIMAQIKDLFDSGVRHHNRKLTIFENEIRLQIVYASTKKTTKFIGFVHNPGSDSKLLLDLASRWLKEK
jgi:hypothetical protein